MNRVTSAIQALIFVSTGDLIGTANVFFGLSVVSVCAAIFVAVLVPETRGKALEEIEIELETSVMDAADSGILSLEDMQVMPVVHVTMDYPSVYVDTTQEVFSRTIFVGLMYLNRDGDGYEASFKEFTLCSEQENLAYSYSSTVDNEMAFLEHRELDFDPSDWEILRNADTRVEHA